MTLGKPAALIQWNCRGLRPNYEEIKCFIADWSPLIICLQETFLRDTDHTTFKGYDMYNKTVVSPIDNRAIGGSSVLVKNTVPHSTIHLNTNLQAVAIRATLHRTVTVCSVYIPPRYSLKRDDLEMLINQLPTPFLLLGDFNAHSDMWGCTNTNQMGGLPFE